MLVLQYERLPASVVNLMPDGWGLEKSPNGWMTSETFFEYIINIFHPWLTKEGIPLPIILCVDGHVSHLTLSLSEFCGKSGIVLIALLPNATHILQPIDIEVFHSLKNGWKNGVHQWTVGHNGLKLKKEHFFFIIT